MVGFGICLKDLIVGQKTMNVMVLRVLRGMDFGNGLSKMALSVPIQYMKKGYRHGQRF